MNKLIFYFFITVSFSLHASNIKFNSIAFNKVKNPAKNTFIYLINGDSDRFRPSQGHNSKITFLDKLDAKRIIKASRDCNCNVVILHDTRGKGAILRTRKKFGVHLKVISNGKTVFLKRFLKYKSYLKWNEVDLTQLQVFTNLLKFSKKVFPQSTYHLVYRGHSFNIINNATPSHYDYSNIKKSYGIKDFVKSIERANIRFETTTFAACSMADYGIAKALIPYSQYMIASQVNIPETGITGFNFDFMKSIHDDSKEIHSVIGSSIMDNFKTVEDKSLFLRETPFASINLEKLAFIETDLDEVISSSTKELASGSESYTYSSDRYVELRIANGASDKVIEIIKTKMKIRSLVGDYDLVEYLKLNQEFSLADSILNLTQTFNNPDFNLKNGLSFLVPHVSSEDETKMQD